MGGSELKLYRVTCPNLNYESESLQYHTYAADHKHAESKISKHALLTAIWCDCDCPTLLSFEVIDDIDLEKSSITFIR